MNQSLPGLLPDTAGIGCDGLRAANDAQWCANSAMPIMIIKELAVDRVRLREWLDKLSEPERTRKKGEYGL